MDDRSLKALEFHYLLENLKEFAVSPLGRNRCESLRPSKDLPLIQSRLNEVLELKEILENQGNLPIRGLKDIGETLKRLDAEGAVLDVRELMDIYEQMVLCKGLIRFLLKREIRAPRLQEKASRLSSLKTLEEEILQALNTKGEILDGASPVLSDIRHRIERARGKAKGILEHLLHREELQPIFQEQLITLRNGRYVLLIKSDCKHQLEGIIHDQSQSQRTFFFEPLQAVAFNNEINILSGEEKKEEYRILADLSERVRSEKEHLWRNLEILGEFDLLYAMAKLSILLGAVAPELNEKGKIDMKEARNPLLTLQKERKVVPIRLRMGDGVRALIISGANSGGKTVALKTLGLLTVMVQSGLPVPVMEGSQVAIFEDIFAAIGEEQNIRENLSTFSGHLLHVNQILEKSGPRSLVLLDELGVGTHAQEGCTLAMGFMDRFREKDVLVVVTTHFDRLKTYGYLHSDVENVAVEFDEETLEPKYTLSYGMSGVSKAFLLAEKIGISEGVLERARHYLDGGDQDAAHALETLERLKADTEKERLKLLQLKEETWKERQRLKESLERIKAKRQEILLRAEEEAKKGIQKLEEELREWLRLKKEEKAPLKILRQNIRNRELQEIKEKYFPSDRNRRLSRSQGGLKVGERVKIESLRSHGILMKVEETSNRVEVVTDKAKVKASISDIIKVGEGEGEVEIQKSMNMPRKEFSEAPFQLNVIGLTVEDALPEVDRFIDRALFHGMEKVRIIHGVGSGRLRSAIGKYLEGHQGVKSFSPGDVMKGGAGITVVELR